MGLRVIDSTGTTKEGSGTVAGGSGGGSNSVMDFRLTLTTGTPVTISDVTGAGTLYCTPFVGNKIALYDGTNWNIRSSAEFSLALTLTSGKPYDIFVYDNSGNPALEILVWTNDTTRATALTTQDGVLVKSGATTRRYVGTLYSSGANTTEDSYAKRYLWNYYNRVPRYMRVIEATASWSYSSGWRQVRASATNQIEWIVGVEQIPVSIFVAGACASTSANSLVGESYMIDGTTNPDNNAQNPTFYTQVANVNIGSICVGTVTPGIGRHYAAWIEYGAGGGTVTFQGAGVHAGIGGTVYG